jgi:hypothetical protein
MSKTKKATVVKVKEKVMAYDLFERKYKKEIEVMTERILDKTLSNAKLKDDDYEDYYDDAYEEAVHVLAFEKGYELE